MRTPRNEDLGSDNPANGAGPERTCVLTRRKGARDELIRLALSPDGEIAPDVRARAPGRGAWIGVTRAELDAANAKGKLKGALQRAFKTADVRVPADLGERTQAALRQAALDRLGMEARAGNLINGAERVEAAARSGKVHLLAPRRRCRRRRAAQARPGLARGRRRRARADIPRTAHYLVVGARPRKCGTRRPDGSRCRFACLSRACPVAGF